MAAEPAGALLPLLWLASPALPVGAFSYSEALEAAVEAGLVRDEAGAGDWLLSQLALAQARSELPLAAAAMAAWAAHDLARVHALNDWVRQTRETAEQRLQTEQTGRSLAEWLRQRDEDDRRAAAAPGWADPRVAALLALTPAPTWPVAFALAAVRAGAAPREGLLAMGFGWAENAMQAAVKAVPLGQRAGQRLLARLAAALPGAVDAALARAPDDEARMAYAPMAAVLGARHETQYSRLFRS